MTPKEKDTVIETSNSGWIHTATLNLEPTPFSVTFSWKDERVTVQLDNGEDLLKLAQIFSDFLTSNGIPNKVKQEQK